jgi:hypothetical protein
MQNERMETVALYFVLMQYFDTDIKGGKRED